MSRRTPQAPRNQGERHALRDFEGDIVHRRDLAEALGETRHLEGFVDEEPRTRVAREQRGQRRRVPAKVPPPFSERECIMAAAQCGEPVAPGLTKVNIGSARPNRVFLCEDSRAPSRGCFPELKFAPVFQYRRAGPRALALLHGAAFARGRDARPRLRVAAERLDR